MNELEWKKWIQDCIQYEEDRADALFIAEQKSSGLEQYKLSVAHRMLTYWFRFRAQQITAQDFSSSLRSYLIVWNTSIVLPGFTVEPGNAYGFHYDVNSGKIHVNYQTPKYLKDCFLKAAYMQGDWYQKAKPMPFDLRTNPFVHTLTGFSRYKSIEQKLAVSGALKTPDGYVTLIAMLTGGGKSLITQTTAYQKEEGLTIVIVPTISLMIDQVRNAKQIIRSDVENEVFSYYSNKPDGLKPFFDALDQKRARLLFLSPETLIKNHRLREKLFQANAEHYIKNLIIDEAHIIIEWGASFRVDYQCLDSFQRNLLKENPGLRTFLLSATYSKEAVKQLRNFYSCQGRWIEIRCDRLRREPRYCIIQAKDYIERHNKLKELVAILPRPMIIYVNSPERADDVQQDLRQYGITNTRTFTGLTLNKERDNLIQQWAARDFDLMIATCAFGVGVDKKDVRTVLHLYVPENPNKYYQEAGRGGRDGLPCLSVVLYTEEDVNTAFKRMQKVLTIEKLSGRWFSMLRSKKTLRKKGTLWLDTSVKPSYNESDDFFSDASDTDISWNVYVLLLFRRNHLIEILDVVYQECRYVFHIRVCEQAIMTAAEGAEYFFEKVRTQEWEQLLGEFNRMKSALRHRNTVCWSEMFSDVYNLTEPYCSGCNCHDHIIDEESSTLPLLRRLPEIESSVHSKIENVMNRAEELLIIAAPAEQPALLRRLMQYGVDSIVFPKDYELSIEEFPDGRETYLLMTVQEFFEFSNRGQYYLSGSVLIFLPTDEYLLLKVLDAAHKLAKHIRAKILFVSSDDMLITRRGKRLSEVIDGPCKQAYIIEKE